MVRWATETYAAVRERGFSMKTVLTFAVMVGGTIAYSAEDRTVEESGGVWSGIKEIEILRALRSRDASTQAAMARHLQAQRLQIARALWRVVEGGIKDPNQAANVSAAMDAMGEMRTIETVPILVENIKFTYDTVAGRRRAFSNMPAVSALIGIGLPSLDPLVKKAGESDDKVIRERAANVLNQVLGTDMAVIFVRDRHDREKEDAKRQRLARLIEQIDKVERNRRFTIGALNPPPTIRTEPK